MMFAIVICAAKQVHYTAKVTKMLQLLVRDSRCAFYLQLQKHQRVYVILHMCHKNVQYMNIHNKVAKGHCVVQMASQLSFSSSASVGFLLALRMSPGFGYGLIWYNGPLAVVSTPVLASPCTSRPEDHVPLHNTNDT